MSNWLERLKIECRHGDLFEADSEAIVVTVTTDFSAYGKLSKRLSGLLGDLLAPQIEEIRKELPEKKMHLGQAVSLRVPRDSGKASMRVLILAALWSHESPYTSNLVYSVYINSLRQAFGLSLGSVSLPIIKVPREILGESLCRVLTDLNGLKGSEFFSVDKMEFVSTASSDVDYLRDFICTRLPNCIAGNQPSVGKDGRTSR